MVSITTLEAEETLNKQFQTKTLKGFGIQELPKATIAAGAIFHYLGENQHKRLDHITSISRIEEERYVWLDRFTVRNLELLSSPNDNANRCEIGTHSAAKAPEKDLCHLLNGHRCSFLIN